MSVEKLKTIVADLFKQSEDAVPILGDSDKKEWMAYYLDDIIHKKGDELQCLLQFNSKSEVINFLEKIYHEKEEGHRELSSPCEKQPVKNKEKAAGIKQQQIKNEKKVSKAKHPQSKKSNKTATEKSNRIKNKVAGKTKEKMSDKTIIVEKRIIIIEDNDPII